ncbi:MAG: hypothetical protein JNL99_01935 [Zoogloea sp.]|nr:hypothetical protein [Zoogloea sp.]
MAKVSPIGHMQCPECGFPDAEIKLDKNGNPYRYCTDCSAQYMTHGRPHKVANLKARMRPVAEAVEGAVAVMAGEAPALPADGQPAPAKRRFLI